MYDVHYTRRQAHYGIAVLRITYQRWYSSNIGLGKSPMWLPVTPVIYESWKMYNAWAMLFDPKTLSTNFYSSTSPNDILQTNAA